MWAYVALASLVVVILGMIFGWLRYRQNQAVELSRLGTENAGLRDALARCEAARKMEKHGRADVARRLDELRPVGDADPAKPA